MTSGKKSARAHFTDLLRERKVTPEDMEKFRQIGTIAELAKTRAQKDCTGTGDRCETGHDCGYDEGGCGSDESCILCDSCMISYDTCSSSQTCPNDG